MNDTIKKLPVTKDRNGNNLRGFVKLADISDNDTTLIMQRYLLTKIETSITREEALVLSQAILEHFEAPAPTTIPHGHGPIGGFHALLDEARAQDHTNIALSRGHANLIAEHIRRLEEQLGALQDKLAQPPALTADQERRLNEHTYIIDLLGHIEDDSNEVVTVFQEDATRRWHVRVGQTRTEFGETLIEALRKHFLHFLGDCPDCRVTDECAATGQACEYAPEGMNGEMQCKYCGKPEAEKDA